jgi:hypothetical protein
MVVMTSTNEYADIDDFKQNNHHRDSSTRSLKMSTMSLYSPVGKTEKDESSKNDSPLMSIERVSKLKPVIIASNKKIPPITVKAHNYYNDNPIQQIYWKSRIEDFATI